MIVVHDYENHNKIVSFIRHNIKGDVHVIDVSQNTDELKRFIEDAPSLPSIYSFIKDFRFETFEIKFVCTVKDLNDNVIRENTIEMLNDAVDKEASEYEEDVPPIQTAANFEEAKKKSVAQSIIEHYRNDEHAISRCLKALEMLAAKKTTVKFEHLDLSISWKGGDNVITYDELKNFLLSLELFQAMHDAS